MPQRAIKTRAPKSIPQRFQMQMPLADLEMVVARLRLRRERGQSKLTKEPSAAKVVRLALRQLFAQTTNEELEELLETTEL